MRRNKKEGNAFVSMGGKMLFGAVIGAAIAILFTDEKTYERFQLTADSFLDMLVINYVAIMVVQAIGMLILNLVCYIKLRSSVKEAMETDDEQRCDELDDKIDIISTVSLNGNGIFFILIFMMFILYNYLSDAHNLTSLALFIPALLYPLFYILTIGVLKRYDPSKNGNPGSMRFQKDWMESCDEAEKMQILTIGYQSFKSSSYIITLGFGITAIIALIFKVGAFAIFITGGMWLIQTIVNSYYNINYKKKK